MATVILRVPSKVQYGYIEIQATPEELGDASLASSPEALASVYMNYVKAFREGEEQALKAAAPAPKPKPETTLKDLGDAMGEMAEAEKMLKEGLGATVVDEDAPYKKTPPAAKAKPWEEKGAVKAPDLGDLFA